MKNFSPIRPSTTFAILALGSALLLSRPFSRRTTLEEQRRGRASGSGWIVIHRLAPVLRHPDV